MFRRPVSVCLCHDELITTSVCVHGVKVEPSPSIPLAAKI
jgi:hypothetical protein